ncbi:PREDICTED: complement factor B-like [Nanorana parkeri]|uniref:complement factor B-like n=1 Tax=Nanorana parkeri TaxID=125878 RepID=UPI00085483F4|nr:PREDICTED: complement factor B-like [Nanorana parkeri]
MMMLLLLLGSCAMSIAAPSYQCDPTKVAINGGNYSISEDGMNVEYKCPKGKYPYPAATRECQRDGQWTDPKRKAACRDFECPRPVMFEGGDYSPRKAKYFVGDVLEFECWGGFDMRGPENRTCQENGKWNGETTKCDDGEGHCPNPGIPIGASKVGTSYRIEGKVTYDCQDGLKIFGSKTRECKENKKWSGSEPSCRSFYTYDTPEEVAKIFGSSLSETIESSDPDRVEVTGDRKLQVRTGGDMNIFLIIDASKSVGPDNFKTAKEIATTFIERVSTFSFTPRYSVLTYASNIIRIVSLSESEINTDADKVTEEIMAFDYQSHDDKQGTNTRGALQEVYNQLSLDNQRNPDTFLKTSNVIILMTDGKHNMGGDPSVEVNKIREFLGIRKDVREDKLDIYVFGLGDDVSEDEINDIASKKDGEKHVFKMESIDDLKKSFDKIINEAEAFEMCGLSKDYSNEVQEKYPWIVKLTVTRPGGVENCKGSVISKNFILTAAHCFHLEDEPHTVNVDIGGSGKKVKNLYRHPKYNPIGKKDKNVPKSFDYDLALVELTQKIEFSSKVRPICLPCTSGTSWALKQRDKEGPCSEQEKLLLSEDLVKALFISEVKKNEFDQMDVQIKQGNKRLGCLADAKKVKDFKDVADIKDVVTDNFLCTGGIDPEVDPQTCKGDSGGPLIIEHKKRYIQVGVISWGTVNSCQGLRRQRPVPAESRDFHATVVQERAWMKEVLAGDLIFLD